MTQVTAEVRPPLATSPSWLVRRPLIAYFVLAYALAWLLWLPFVLSRGGGVGVLPLATPADASGLAYLLVLAGALASPGRHDRECREPGLARGQVFAAAYGTGAGRHPMVP